MIYCYTVQIEDYRKIEAGTMKLAIGRIRVTSDITGKSERLIFSGLHLGAHDFNGGVSLFQGDIEYQRMKSEMIAVFKKGAVADIVRMMDKYFGMHNYSLLDLFKDEQRKILNLVISSATEECKETYRRIYEDNHGLMEFLQDTGIPIPKAFRTAADFTLNVDLKKAFAEGMDEEKIHNIISDMKRWQITIESLELEFKVRHIAGETLGRFAHNPSDIPMLLEVQKIIQLLQLLPIEINFWHMQNIYFKIAKTTYKEFLLKMKSGDVNAIRWVEVFKQIGHDLFFNTAAVLPEA